MRLHERRGHVVALALVLALTTSCGESDGGSREVSDVPAMAPATRASSLRLCREGCDFREECDLTQFDAFCPESACGPQQGDGRCHRACAEYDGSACGPGESCRQRKAIVSDTPTVFHWLCLCDAPTGCAAPPMDEGGITAFRSETHLPIALFDHAAAASGRRLFLAGGISVADPILNAHAPVSQVFVAEAAGDGSLGAWRTAGTLPEALQRHAMVVVGRRLYVLGGEPADSDAPASVDRTWSASIDATGRIGAFRAERALPSPRSGLTAVAVGSRLILGGGEKFDGSTGYASNALWIAEVDAGGALGPFETVASPGQVFSGGLAASRERLYVVANGVYSVALARLLDGEWRAERRGDETPSSLLHAALLDDLLIFALWGGATASAPIAADGRLGEFRPASGGTGPNTAFTFTAVDGTAYLTGGTTGFFDAFATVWSTHRR